MSPVSARRCKRPVVARFATTALLEPLQIVQRLVPAATIKESLTVQVEGKQEIRRPAKLSNRDILHTDSRGIRKYAAVPVKNNLLAEWIDPQVKKKRSGDAS